jgi:hypothetical protein
MSPSGKAIGTIRLKISSPEAVVLVTPVDRVQEAREAWMNLMDHVQSFVQRLERDTQVSGFPPVLPVDIEYVL